MQEACSSVVLLYLPGQKVWPFFNIFQRIHSIQTQNIHLNWESIMSIFLIDIIHNFRYLTFSVIFSHSSRLWNLQKSSVFTVFKHFKSSSIHSHFQIESQFILWNVHKHYDFLTWIQLLHTIHSFCTVTVQTLVTFQPLWDFCIGVYGVEWKWRSQLTPWGDLKIIRKPCLQLALPSTFHPAIQSSRKIMTSTCRYTCAGVTVDLWGNRTKTFGLVGI